jgi:hypothetical protein
MHIDLRGLRHPEHIKGLRDALEGLCTVYDDIEVLLEPSADIKLFEAYLKSCNAKYTKNSEGDHISFFIKAPFSMCG